MGNLTRDPELRVTPRGTAICQFGLAINRKFNTEGGEARQDVLFIDVEAWEKQAETIAKYCTKGAPLYVEGRLRLDQWEDKTTQEKRSRMKVVLTSFQFLGTRDRGGEGHQPDAQEDVDQTQERRAPPRSAPSRDLPPPASQDNLDEDVPF
jgi:single-strand DNA-binding protein